MMINRHGWVGWTKVWLTQENRVVFFADYQSLNKGERKRKHINESLHAVLDVILTQIIISTGEMLTLSRSRNGKHEEM